MDRLIRDYITKLKTQNLLLPAWYENGKIIMLNQLELPAENYLALSSVEEIARAIQDMTIRGSGAIALAGCYGILMAAFHTNGDRQKIIEAGELLKATRPTAVNLNKTVTALTENLSGYQSQALLGEIQHRVIQVIEKQLAAERKIGEYGAALVQDGETIMTICHAGAVAGFGYGGRTLSVFRKAIESGKKIQVIACETRPYFQGARITAWELKKFGIPVSLITDNMAGAIMQKGMVSRVITGSDRIAANGDTANKIGTYMLALAAKDNGIPFHISTSKYNIDLTAKSGAEIEIELRDSSEVLFIHGRKITAAGIDALYPAFDITPSEDISAIITENGVLVKPYAQKLAELCEGSFGNE